MGKLGDELSDELRELRAELDKSTKLNKDDDDSENDTARPVFDEEEFIKRMEENRVEKPPYSTLNPTPSQEVENRLKKRIDDLEERLQKLESFIFQEFTKGGSQE